MIILYTILGIIIGIIVTGILAYFIFRELARPLIRGIVQGIFVDLLPRLKPVGFKCILRHWRKQIEKKSLLLKTRLTYSVMY